MKILFAFLFVIPFGISAQQITDPKEYHELLTLVQYNVSSEFYAISIFASEEDEKSIQDYKELLIKMVRTDIKELQATGGFKGDDDWNKITLELLKFYEKLAVDHYDQLIAIFQSDSKTPEIPEDIVKALDQETLLTVAYTMAREAFEKKYGVQPLTVE